MIERQKLEVWEWYVYCPICEEILFVKNDDLWEDSSEKDQTCTTCGKVFAVTTRV